MKPFLKWAGGKFRLMKKINQVLPTGTRLIEPFVGSGAVFLNTNYPNYLVADTNPDLINLYTYLKNENQIFVDFCGEFFQAKNNTKENFHALRHVFNTSKDTRLKSAVFVYLNRHCFNGLCRYSEKSGFNVPFGRYTEPKLPEMEMLAFAKQSKNVDFLTQDFRETMQLARKGDVVYCDPPYMPLSDTANFTKYNAKHFGMQDQLDLVNIALELRKKGIPVVISNHDTPQTQKIYQSATLYSFEVQRYISASANNRKKATELLAVF